MWCACLLVAIAQGASKPVAGPVTLHVDEIESPAGASSRCPRFTVNAAGAIYLSWLDTEGADSVLRYARLEGSSWSVAREIARGERWFVNWADFPSLAVLDDEHLLAHFLQKSGAGDYDYDVRVTRSGDGGATWSTPERLHTHAGAGEHGFVSLAPRSGSDATAIWLDGRNTKPHGEGGGEMALYARAIDGDGHLGDEIVVDPRVCDCCPTSAARLPDGALLVACRDRSPDEVRDISVVRIVDGVVADSSWSSGDGWKIAGCPVNGPVLAVRGENVALTWFTFGSDMRARVSCAFSKDGGRSFGPPIRVASTRAHGRVDALFDDSNRLLVTWLEADPGSAEWRVARVDVGGRVIDERRVVATTSTRESGLARLAVGKSGTFFVWTQTEPVQRVAVSRLRWE